MSLLRPLDPAFPIERQVAIDASQGPSGAGLIQKCERVRH
jgi:hypothetical protein